MALSRLAAQFAAEIKQHDWSDAPYRGDRAGHRHDSDGYNRTPHQLTPEQTVLVTMNVAWNVAQVLGYNDPNFDEHEFFKACGLSTHNRDGRPSGIVTAGLRFRMLPGDQRQFQIPGTYDFDEEPKPGSSPAA